MPVPAAYLTVIIIWSTTPLAIQWSGIGVGYEFGVAARMLIGLLALLLIVRLKGMPLPWNRHACAVYAVSGISIFIAMSLVYWSAQYIPSGWISVIFGLAPIITSLFASLILRENNLTAGRLLGMLLGLGGLAVVFAEGLSLNDAARMGVAGITIGTIAHALGAVLLQKLYGFTSDFDYCRQPDRRHAVFHHELRADAELAAADIHYHTAFDYLPGHHGLGRRFSAVLLPVEKAECGARCPDRADHTRHRPAGWSLF